MAMFVHLTPESLIKLILRNGIRMARKLWNGQRGIFAVPVTRNFYISHQWLRELKRGRGPIAGVYFRVPDDELVWVGHYNRAHRQMSAAKAVAAFMNTQNPEGYQVFIPRRISSSEIHRIRHLPQVVGWPYMPGSHNWTCLCVVCNPPGTINSRKKREAWEAKQQRM